MDRKINKTREILGQMRKDGKVGVFNDAAEMAKIKAMNEDLEKMRREYQIKETKSNLSAKSAIINA